jgi:hypothetical protein
VQDQDAWFVHEHFVLDLRMITPQSQTFQCKFWVDADACPKVIKEILYRAANGVPVMVGHLGGQPTATSSTIALYPYRSGAIGL